MLAKKKSIKSVFGALLVGALALTLAGCSPAGPRALLRGKKYLDHGDYARAVTELRAATGLLATNATAWNYYGVALQSAGQLDDAATAYQNALKYDRDLVEAHFNLGSLWLEENKPDAAKAELTDYTLRRSNDPAGWLKLGSAQLRLNETAAAERSFGSALALKPHDAEAYNGLGLARIQRRMPRDAVKFFAAAVQVKPDFAAAILNLATASQEYLHDDKTALENYRRYLALTPRPANWDAVNALANQLERPQTVAMVKKTVPPPVTAVVAPRANPPAQPRKIEPRNNSSHSSSRENNVHPTPAPRERTQPIPAPQNVSPTRNVAPQPAPIRSEPVQVVKLQAEPKIFTSPRAATTNPQKAVADSTPENATPPVAVESTNEVSTSHQQNGLWHRLFGAKKNSPDSEYLKTGITPLPADNPTASTPASAPASAPPKVISFPRYHYRSPGKPAAGDRRAADGAFTKARLYEQEQKWTDAWRWYYQAAQFDPSWFAAQYNAGVLAQRLQNFSVALPSYENALAIKPDSVDARYNFAMALKAAGYVPDAAAQLEKILAANPDSARAHLALANIDAQSLHDPAAARPHYLKVLELEPDSPQATDIRFWLSANSK